MNRRHTSMAILLGLLLSSCSTYKAAKTYTFDKTQVYSQDFDQVWSGIIEWFAEKNIPIRTIEKASGLIVTEYGLRVSDDICDCGQNGTYQKVKERTASFNVFVRKVEAGTRVTITLFCSSKLSTSDLYGSGPASISDVDCNSTGMIELELFDALAVGR